MSEKVTIYITWQTKKAYMDSAFKNKRSLSSEISIALEENLKSKKDTKEEKS